MHYEYQRPRHLVSLKMRMEIVLKTLVYKPFNHLTQPHAQGSFMELCFQLFKLGCVIQTLSTYITVYAQYIIKNVCTKLCFF